MDIEITLKNYRCFPESKPARITVRDGFTAFLGVNNSGKSSLLRFFFEFRQLFATLASDRNEIVAGLRGQQRSFAIAQVADANEVFHDRNNRNLEIEIKPLVPEGPPPVQWSLTITVHRPSNVFTLAIKRRDAAPRTFPEANLDFEGWALRQDGNKIFDFSAVHDACEALMSTLYIGPFRNAINVGSKSDYFDISVGQSFIQNWRNLKTGGTKKLNEEIFDLTGDIGRIFEFDSLEINPGAGDETLKCFVNGKSYSLGEQGSGLAQFILVLANAATKRRDYILIDEPELNLHPSLQLDFLTTLGSYAKRGVIFATHSYGLARARAQQVYTVQRSRNGESELRSLESTPQLSELLGELSFSAFRELGFDKVLLVEGITEVLAVQQFLRIYQKDHKVLLIPLGGDNFINGRRGVELEEIKRITPNISAVIDSERSSQDAAFATNREAFRQLCETPAVGINCHVLERRATENYLSDSAVKRTMGVNYRALTAFERLKDMNPRWSKDDNWRIARMMTEQEIANTDLGHFLAGL